MSLTENQKKRILGAIDDIEIDLWALDSYRNYGHPDQNFARFAEPDDEDWDEQEEWEKKIDQFKYYIEADGVFEYIKGSDEEFEADEDREITKEALAYCDTLY
jgi:hypothetical protein